MARKGHWAIDEKQQRISLSGAPRDSPSVLPATRVFTGRSGGAIAAKLAGLGHNANATNVSRGHDHLGHQSDDSICEMRPGQAIGQKQLVCIVGAIMGTKIRAVLVDD